MTISSLPQELIDHILSFLASDAPALRACARVHSSWLDPCRRCLFAHKTLYTVDWKLIGAHAVIKRNPALAEYIRAATWDIWDQGAQTPRRALFASLLRRLHRVSALTIEYHQQVPDTTPYAGLVQFVRYAPTATVTALRLAGIVFPSCTGLCAFVASFPTLTDLALHKLRWAVDDADGGDAHGGAVLTTPTLQVLSITDMHLDAQRILSWLLRHPSPPCLRSLHLDVPASPPDIAPLSAVLEHSGPSLEELTIRGAHDFRSNPHTRADPRSHSLRGADQSARLGPVIRALQTLARRKPLTAYTAADSRPSRSLRGNRGHRTGHAPPHGARAARRRAEAAHVGVGRHTHCARGSAARRA